MRKQLITGIIHVKNEERNIEQAILSLRQIADEIIVADMCSVDSTAKIAEALGARVIAVQDYGIPEPAFKTSYAAATHPWIFRLDADEILPATLATQLLASVDSGKWDVVEIPRLNFFFGSPLLHTGWGPISDRHTRLFRKSALAAASSAVHTADAFYPQARVLKLSPEIEASIWHFNYLDWSHFIEKLDRYTTVEAQALAESGQTLRRRALVWVCGKEVLWRYFRRRGYKDGYRGAVLTLLMVAYRVTTYAKWRQLTEVGDRESIRRHYADVAAAIAKAVTVGKVISKSE